MEIGGLKMIDERDAKNISLYIAMGINKEIFDEAIDAAKQSDVKKETVIHDIEKYITLYQENTKIMSDKLADIKELVNDDRFNVLAKSMQSMLLEGADLMKTSILENTNILNSLVVCFEKVSEANW